MGGRVGVQDRLAYFAVAAIGDLDRYTVDSEMLHQPRSPDPELQAKFVEVTFQVRQLVDLYEVHPLDRARMCVRGSTRQGSGCLLCGSSAWRPSTSVSRSGKERSPFAAVPLAVRTCSRLTQYPFS